MVQICLQVLDISGGKRSLAYFFAVFDISVKLVWFIIVVQFLLLTNYVKSQQKFSYHVEY